jgi:hypothetical protein
LAISLEKPPRICCIAIWWEAALSEDIRSATASACDKSSLPFRKRAGWILPDQPCGIQYAAAAV